MEATPLETLLRAHGACIAVRHGRRVAAHYGSVASETAVCLRSVGLADRFGRVTLEIRGGRDTIDEALARVTGLGPVARLGAHLALMRCAEDDLRRCCSLLDDDDLLVADVTGAQVALGLIGPGAGSVVARAGLAAYQATVLGDGDGYEILVPPRLAGAAWLHLLHAGRPLGLACVGFDALEHLAVAHHRRPVPNVALTMPARGSIQPR